MKAGRPCGSDPWSGHACQGSLPKHGRGFVLPWTTQIPPQIQPDNFDRMGSEFLHQSCVQGICRQFRDLVLDRDVWLPLLHVLSAQPRHEGSLQCGVDFLQLRADNRERHAGAQMTKATDVDCDWGVPGCNLDEMPANLCDFSPGRR